MSVPDEEVKTEKTCCADVSCCAKGKNDKRVTEQYITGWIGTGSGLKIWVSILFFSFRID